jgi:drug/metabolite transporter (DMT)-like permease
MAWGSSFLFIDIALDDVQPGVVTLARVGLGALTLAVVPADRRSIDRTDRPRLLVLGIFWLAVPETLLPLAQSRISSAVTGMLVGAVPVVTALVAAVLLKRRPGVPQQLGVAVGLAGVVLISWSGIGEEGNTAVVGVVGVLVAVVLYAMSANAVAPLQHKYGSLAVMRWVLAFGTVFTIPYALVGLDRSDLTASAAGALVVLGVIATGLAFVAYGGLIGRVGATRASGVLYVIPVVALVLGVTFRSDEVGPLGYLGCACVVLATVFVSREGR